MCVLGVLLFREHLGRIGWLGAAGVVATGFLLTGAEGASGMLGAPLVAAACLCWGLDNHLTALIDGITPARSTLAKGAVAGTTNLVVGAWLAPLSAPPWIFIAALGVGAVSYGLGIALYIASAHELGATRAQGVFAAAVTTMATISTRMRGSPLSARHRHAHRHERLVHAHPHWPDLHHRHEHSTRGD